MHKLHINGPTNRPHEICSDTPVKGISLAFSPGMLSSITSMIGLFIHAYGMSTGPRGDFCTHFYQFTLQPLYIMHGLGCVAKTGIQVLMMIPGKVNAVAMSALSHPLTYTLFQTVAQVGVVICIGQVFFEGYRMFQHAYMRRDLGLNKFEEMENEQLREKAKLLKSYCRPNHKQYRTAEALLQPWLVEEINKASLDEPDEIRRVLTLCRQQDNKAYFVHVIGILSLVASAIGFGLAVLCPTTAPGIIAGVAFTAFLLSVLRYVVSVGQSSRGYSLKPDLLLYYLIPPFIADPVWGFIFSKKAL